MPQGKTSLDKLRVSTVCVVICMIIFFLFTFVSMLLYPGGSEFDLDQEGYRFFHNFFSDLGMKTAWNKESNLLSSLFFNFAVISSGITLIPYLWFYPSIYELQMKWHENLDKLEKKSDEKSDEKSEEKPEKKPKNGLMIWTQIIGFATSLCFIGIGVCLKDVIYDPHIFFARTAFILALPFSIFFSILLFRSNKRKIYGIALLFLGFLILVYIILFIIFPEDESTHILWVVEQKIIVYYLIFSFMIQGIGTLKQIKEINFER